MKNVIKESPVTIFLLGSNDFGFYSHAGDLFWKLPHLTKLFLILAGCMVLTLVYFQVNCGA